MNGDALAAETIMAAEVLIPKVEPQLKPYLSYAFCGSHDLRKNPLVAYRGRLYYYYYYCYYYYYYYYSCYYYYYYLLLPTTYCLLPTTYYYYY